jgi:EAL domain-containing protein (putative c-di-GMP-specific phosphodiesterase class I)
LSMNSLIGFEALLRWQHPDKGLILPGAFIPFAQESGLIIPIGLGVIREACRQMKAYHDCFKGGLPLVVSVNLSVGQFFQADIAKHIHQALQDSGLKAQHLILEITETAVMEDAEYVIKMMKKLKRLGVLLSVDDFGTGTYSPVKYMQRLPIDSLKIDYSFINKMTTSKESAFIVRTIIELSRNLGIKSVAEGIETPDQLTQLQTLQCEYGQGYLFSRPIDADSANALLASPPDRQFF